MLKSRGCLCAATLPDKDFALKACDLMKKIKHLFENKKLRQTSRKVMLLAVLMLISVSILCACSAEPNDGTTPSAGEETYTIHLITNAGQALPNVDVFIYADATLNDLVAVAKTDKTGSATFTARFAEGYAAVLKGVPAGYPVEKSYPLTGKTTELVLTAQLIADANLNQDKFGVNSVMFDFTITDTENNQYTLSELLKQKKAVVLNFWFSTCGPCKIEFPFMQEAWQQYSDDIALLALNPVDDEATVKQYRAEQGLSIPMAKVDASWANAFNMIYFPTTMVIDRFGNINMIHIGSIDNAETFENLFAYFADQEYSQQSDLTIEDFAVASEQGTAENPLEFGGITEFDVTVEPGQSVYCHVYKVSGMVLRIQDASVSVQYEDNTYLPENGVVSLLVESEDTYTPVKLVLTNTGNEKKTYHATLTFPAGTMGNPFELQVGSFTADVPEGSDQGVYYTYIAEETGELTIKCVGATDGVAYAFTLYNLNTYVYKALDTDGENDTLTIAVNKGDEVQFTAGSLPDDENQYPAVKLDFVASFEKKEQTTQDPTESTNPAPTDPKPTDPAPTTPQPTEPKPTQPKPTEPKPTQPKPTEPQPTQPQPTEPTPTEPEESDDWDAPHTELYVGKAYHITVGTNSTLFKSGKITYFLFTPSTDGQYRFSCSSGTLAFYGNNLSFIIDQTATLDDRTTTSFTVNIKESNLGSSYLISVTAPAGVTAGTVTVTRTGDAVLSWDDLPYTPYSGTYTPKPFTFSGGTLKYIKITGKPADFVPVLGSDGYYHLNSADGPLLYLNLTNGEYSECALNGMLHSNRPVIQGTVKDENGKNISKEQYNDLVQKYVDCSDGGLYPLTADLIRILKTQNDNWYLYLASQYSKINKDLAWMCNICYVP